MNSRASSSIGWTPDTTLKWASLGNLSNSFLIVQNHLPKQDTQQFHYSSHTRLSPQVSLDLLRTERLATLREFGQKSYPTIHTQIMNYVTCTERCFTCVRTTFCYEMEELSVKTHFLKPQRHGKVQCSSPEVPFVCVCNCCYKHTKKPV